MLEILEKFMCDPKLDPDPKLSEKPDTDPEPQH
jgi:hypothetical protein